MIEKNTYKNRCFIVGTGESLNKIDLSLLENEITIGINLILKHPTFVPNYLCVADTTVMEHNYDTIFNDKMNDGTYVIANGCLMTGKGNCIDGSGSTCRGIKLDSDYQNIYTLNHWEKSRIFDNHVSDDRKTLLKTDEYYIDIDNFATLTSYGGSTVDNLAIPLAVYLGFKEIYLLGCDGGWNHFYDKVQKPGKRDWINYKHVIKELDLYGVKLLNCDYTNYFKELDYVKLEDVLNEF